MGGSRWPTADAPRGGDRRRKLGHRSRRAPRPRWPRGSAGDSHSRAGDRAGRGAREPPLPRGRAPARLGPGPALVRSRAGGPRPGLPGDPLGLAAAGGRQHRRPGRRPRGGAAADQGPGCAAGPASGRVRRRASARPRDRLSRRAGTRPRGRLRLRGARPRLRRRGPARPARRGLRPRRPVLRALARRGRGRDGGSREERRRPCRRGRRAARAQRGRDRRRPGLARVHRPRDRARRRGSRRSPASPASATSPRP